MQEKKLPISSKFILLLLLFPPQVIALTTNATITIKNPLVTVVNNKAMNCTYIGSGTYTGSAFDSPTVCGSYTSSPELINQSNVSCTYIYSKNYSAEGACTANATFYHTAYGNKGVGITTTGTIPAVGYYDDLAPTGQIAGDCQSNTTCYTDPQCNNTYNESVNTTIYTINWDTTQGDCTGYGKLWYSSYTGGVNYSCCGDDGAYDNFYWWSTTTCMYCNAGVNNSATSKCSATLSNCSGATSPTCHSGDTTYCCYNVGCSSTGVTGSETNMVGGNCTCISTNCSTNGKCSNSSWPGSGCYTGVVCSSTGWSYTTLDGPPIDITNPSISPSAADPETSVTVNGTVTDTAPVTGNLEIEIFNSSVSTPTYAASICHGNSVASGSNSSCTFTASAAGCSAGNCTVKLLAYETTADACGNNMFSLNFVNISFTYRDRNISTPILNAPTSDPSITVGNNFTLNCTPITGNASNGINMTFQFNSTSASWANISTSGGLTTTQTNPVANVTNATPYAINVTGSAAGTYWVRCQVYNSSYLANSTTQQVTVNNFSTQLSQSASPVSPQLHGTTVNFNCNYSLQSDGSAITDANVYLNINGTDFSTSYSSGNYTYSTSSLNYGDNSWYCKASKTNYTPQTGSTQIYSIIVPSVTTDQATYSSCGAVFYKVGLYDKDSKLVNSYLSARFIDPNLVTVITQVSLYPNNGTGIYLGSYQLEFDATSGKWMLKITETAGIIGVKEFDVS